MRRPLSLVCKGIHEDKITKNNNKYEHTTLSEPAGSQKESWKESIIERNKLSKSILIVDDDPDMTSIFSLGLQDEGFSPTVAAVGVIISIIKLRSPEDTVLEHGCT